MRRGWFHVQSIRRHGMFAIVIAANGRETGKNVVMRRDIAAFRGKSGVL
jgi:hypothetical protein